MSVKYDKCHKFDLKDLGVQQIGKVSYRYLSQSLRYFLNHLSEFLFNFEDEADKQDAELDRMAEENFGRRYARCRNGGAVKKN